MQLPEHNSHITFSRVPNGSYASVGAVYLVTRTERNRVHLENMGPTGGRTSDNVAMYRHAQWQEV